ncbi:MAG TPA: DsbC family protein [Burkholderiaceae bacterium]|nr:DsbC family protein [Burkholderiaceae bacterium]
MSVSSLLRNAAVVSAVLLALPWAQADEAAIRKNLPERIPKFPKIDEVRKTAVPGIYEVRFGAQIRYVDENADYMFEQGNLYDLRSHANLTQERVNKLMAFDFSELQLKDAIVWKNGNGRRKMAVFVDPNCGYCKQFERSIVELKDVTVYTFLIPILGGDSPQKARAVWCSNDSITTWREWMLHGKAPMRAMGACDASAIDRNLAFATKYRIDGTPAIIFENSTRVQSALPLEELEKRLAQASRKS